ncbi:hypothetical protein ROA7450_00949 [Roseovarius albus]|uniref:Histidine kinase n=1 Tax=Roseovarius albus TaxID=1247867 RepID=A0A1X6YKS6_9RHOB|nr:DUF6446 family protein [Roseovarius albus]SLN23690.1 hypothetical protein ROA7450_00949 [Roseovarius albus]
MTGKILAAMILIAALAAGVGMYYLQVYHFYEEVEGNGTSDVQVTALTSGAAQAIAFADFEAIDSESSPIRYRACFTTDLSLDDLKADFTPYPDAVPLTAPGWFDCFDAKEIGAALEAGTAQAFLGVKDIKYGIDRVVAVMDDGRGFVWQQINRCGEVVFDGQRAPEGCPTPPKVSGQDG